MKRMKDQVAIPHQPYSNYPAAGSMASGYPTSRPSTNASSRFGHLPILPQSTLSSGLVPPVRIRPGSGLQLSVKALPNSSGFQPTTPRERPSPLGHRLSSSDSTAIEHLKPPDSSHPRRHSTGDHLLRARPKQPPLGKIQKELEVLPPPRRPPSSKRRSGEVLPPIGMQVQEEFSHLLAKERDLFDLSDKEEDETDSESSSDSEDELFSDGSEAPPSRPGFESEAEQSGYMLNVPFPDVNQSASFPATLIQDLAQLDTERYAAGINASGLSVRVDNIVRAFRINGPLDKELLRKALDQVASLHSLLRASFQRTGDKLYVQTSNGGDVSVPLDTPVVGHEHHEDLIMNARRKIFQLPMKNNLVSVRTECSHDNDDLAIKVFSVTSVTGSDSSDMSKSPGSGRALGKRVSFAPPNMPENRVSESNETASNLPTLEQASQNTSDTSTQVLLRAKLSSKSQLEHTLVLSFPRIVCDFWSSCLFTYQLSDAYAKLEKSSSYRPSLAATRIESRRLTVVNAHEKMKSRGSNRRRDAASRLLQKRTQEALYDSKKGYVPPFPSRLLFQQVAQRESQLILMLSREKLWNFWDSMVTAIIRRQRGPNRVKVVPPIRVPTGLGESVSSRLRPQTSRLRPLTASRNRPQTAKRGSGFLGDIGLSREALAGPKTKFCYLKIEEQVCSSFKQSLPEMYLSYLKEDETLSLMCLGAYVLMLGKCCRGWGVEEGPEKSGRDGASRILIHDSSADFTAVATDPVKQRCRFPRDPLQKYKAPGSTHAPKPVVFPQSSPGAVRYEKRGAITGKLDLGSFLIGVDVSLRHSDPQQSQGLFGPLTNDIGIRVNLDPRESFADLVLSLWRSTLSARKHGHFPFNTIAEEVGLVRGLPIKFSYYYQRDIAQLTNPNEFYFTETAMGVEAQGLARLGSTCYLTPLNGKMDDSCHMELLLWESYEGDHICGGIRYQPHVIKTELVESFSKELCRLVSAIAYDPCKSALKFAQAIHPPFLNFGRTKKYRSYRKPTAGL